MDESQSPQEIELSVNREPDPAANRKGEIFDRARAKIERALEEAREELGELAEDAREEFDELREKAPGWINDARRKVADFLEPDPKDKPPAAG